MAFRTFVYIDVEKLTDYLAVLGRRGGSRGPDASLKGKLNFGVGSLEAGISSAKPREEAMSYAEAYELFERDLRDCEGDDYFDVLEDDCDMSTIPPMSIVRCSGYVGVPESFDMFAMISEYLEPLKNAGALSLDGDPATNEFALSFFEQANADIPIVIDGNEVLISSKLKASNFVEGNYQALESLDGDELVVLCKVHSLVRADRVVIFDPAKDFLRLNRAMRRSMQKTSGLEPIEEDGPVLKAEIIAIYH